MTCMPATTAKGILDYVCWWIGAVTPGKYLLFWAEMFVGIVIYLELEHSRFGSSLEKATARKSDEERRELYTIYLDLPELPRTERMEAFRQKIYQDETIKTKCDNQIALFNEMGFAANRWFRIPFRENRFVTLFPHAPVYMWRIIGPYLCDRRAATGPWFAKSALMFMKHSVEYVLRYDRPLKMKRADGQPGIEITIAEMKEMQLRLDAVIAGKDFSINS